MRVSFLIPAYNEERTIGEVLDRIDALGLDSQVIVVDDGSTDGTSAILDERRRDGLIVLRQPNRGKGAALRAAIPHVDGDIAVIQDADMEYDPAEVPALIEPIERGVAAIVKRTPRTALRPKRDYELRHL
jgi:glycosyltransferase involved in cell wall biosynthesis